mmetsp:Transcript_23903/g.43215  ORF Transcript_23903/g.43215 Transcript_23903/m.43215 type:complete len:445 (-) Transcript_23903:81-1415(-)
MAWHQLRKSLLAFGKSQHGALVVAAGGTTGSFAVLVTCCEEAETKNHRRSASSLDGYKKQELPTSVEQLKEKLASSTTNKLLTQRSTEINYVAEKESQSFLVRLFGSKTTKKRLLPPRQTSFLMPPEKVGSYSYHGQDSHQRHVTDDSKHAAPGKKKWVTVVYEKINQDRGNVTFPFYDDKKSALFATFDGHGSKGELVAEYCMQTIPERLQQHPELKTNLEKAVHEIFLKVDKEIRSMAFMEPMHSGSTACLVLIRGQQLSMINVGDSRAVLGTRNNKDDDGTISAVDLTIDQVASNRDERKRILERGGYISEPKEAGMAHRVWLDPQCTRIGLGISRSLGDHALKHSGIIPDPVVTDRTLTPNDEFIIIASDGVWCLMESIEAVNIVQDGFNKGMGASEACLELIEASKKRWNDSEGNTYRDDITAIVIRLDDLWNDANNAV